MFTRSAPCVNNVANNGGIVCVEYYRQVTAANPSLNFHIFFPANSGSIGQNIGNEDFIRLVTHLAEQLSQPANPAVPGYEWLNNFRIEINAGNCILQVLTNPQQDHWANIATRPVAGGSWIINPTMENFVRGRFFNRINNYLKNAPAQVEGFFNAVYGNPGRISYHPM